MTERKRRRVAETKKGRKKGKNEEKTNKTSLSFHRLSLRFSLSFTLITRILYSVSRRFLVEPRKKRRRKESKKEERGNNKRSCRTSAKKIIKISLSLSFRAVVVAISLSLVNVLLERLHERRLGHGPDHDVLLLAVLEDHHGGAVPKFFLVFLA